MDVVGENKSWQKETTTKEVQQHTATEVVLHHHMLCYVWLYGEPTKKKKKSFALAAMWNKVSGEKGHLKLKERLKSWWIGLNGEDREERCYWIWVCSAKRTQKDSKGVPCSRYLFCHSIFFPKMLPNFNKCISLGPMVPRILWLWVDTDF